MAASQKPPEFIEDLKHEGLEAFAPVYAGQVIARILARTGKELAPENHKIALEKRSQKIIALWDEFSRLYSAKGEQRDRLYDLNVIHDVSFNPKGMKTFLSANGFPGKEEKTDPADQSLYRKKLQDLRTTTHAFHDLSLHTTEESRFRPLKQAFSAGLVRQWQTFLDVEGHRDSDEEIFRAVEGAMFSHALWTLHLNTITAETRKIYFRLFPSRKSPVNFEDALYTGFEQFQRVMLVYDSARNASFETLLVSNLRDYLPGRLIQLAKKQQGKATSLPANEDGDEYPIEDLRAMNPSHSIITSEDEGKLQRGLAAFNPQDRNFVCKLLGLDGEEKITPTKLSEEMGISREAVRLRQNQAMHELRLAMDSNYSKRLHQYRTRLMRYFLDAEGNLPKLNVLAKQSGVKFMTLNALLEYNKNPESQGAFSENTKIKLVDYLQKKISPGDVAAFSTDFDEMRKWVGYVPYKKKNRSR